jgi:methyl coenzyme M reductase beta subunit
LLLLTQLGQLVGHNLTENHEIGFGVVQVKTGMQLHAGHQAFAQILTGCVVRHRQDAVKGKREILIAIAQFNEYSHRTEVLFHRLPLFLFG